MSENSASGAAIAVLDTPLDPPAVEAQVAHDGAGAVVTFQGQVRIKSRGKEVVRLEYEAYRPMAEKVLGAIKDDVEKRWPGTRCAIHHRVGTLGIGDLAVVIAVSAAHRAEAFEGCRHAIEELKKDVPIWKREVFTDGAEWVGLGP